MTILLLLLSNTTELYSVVAALKTTGVPKLILVPEIVPTIAVPLLELPSSLYAITTVPDPFVATLCALVVPALYIFILNLDNVIGKK